MSDISLAQPAAAALHDPAPSQSVGGYLVTAVPVAPPERLVGEVCDWLQGQQFDDASHIFVVDDTGCLTGVIAVGDVFAAAKNTPLSQFAQRANRPVVSPTTDRETAASLAIRSGRSTLAVCEADGHFVGAVPATALIRILRDEHLEDLHHMVGILGKSDAALAALTGPPHRRALYRLPWLMVGMVGSALATLMMMQFESALTANIAVAFFIPAIVYLADAVGTQSEAVAVRGLSLTGADPWWLVSGEVGTGILIGAALGMLAFPVVWFTFGNVALAATVAITLFVASGIATSIGFALPWLFSRLGSDPALGSGPLATVIQDMLSLSVYFLVATILLF